MQSPNHTVVNGAKMSFAMTRGQSVAQRGQRSTTQGAEGTGERRKAVGEKKTSAGQGTCHGRTPARMLLIKKGCIEKNDNMDKKTHCLFLFITIFIAASEADNPNNPYCRISKCFPNEHTLCRFPDDQLGATCGTVSRIGLNDDEKTEILNLHTSYRAKVYSGVETGGKNGRLPPSRFHSYLIWNDTLALIAQRWAQQCKLGHDKCRNLEEHLVGQNVGFIEKNGENVDNLKVEVIVQQWYAEVAKCSANDVFYFNRPLAEAENFHRYSQMIWQYSTQIGCGAMRYYVQNTAILFLVCNYAPKGNFSGRPIYFTYMNATG